MYKCSFCGDEIVVIKLPSVIILIHVCVRSYDGKPRDRSSPKGKSKKEE